MRIWQNGEMVTDTIARPSLQDRGFTLGDGLFETLRFEGGEVPGLERHRARLTRSCVVLGFENPFDRYDLAQAARTLCFEQNLAQAALRLTVSRGEMARGLAPARTGNAQVWMTASPLAPPPDSVSLGLVSICRNSTSPASVHKTLSYTDGLQARRMADGMGADMALMRDEAGRLASADCANLFWQREGQWFTPSEACGILPGTMRARILEERDVIEGEYPLEDLLTADRITLTNALMGEVEVSRIVGVG